MQHNIATSELPERDQKYPSIEYEFVMSEFGHRGSARHTESNKKRWDEVEFNHKEFSSTYFTITKQAMKKTREKKMIALNTQAHMDLDELDYHMNRYDDPKDAKNVKRQKKIQKEKQKAIEKAKKSSKKVRPNQAQHLAQENKDHIWPLNIIKSSLFNNTEVPLRDPNNVIIHIQNKFFKLIYVSEIDHLIFKAETNIFSRDYLSRMTQTKIKNLQEQQPQRKAGRVHVEETPIFIEHVKTPDDARHYLRNAKVDSKMARKRLKKCLNNLENRRLNSVKQSEPLWVKPENVTYILNYDNDFDFCYRVTDDFEILLMMCFSLTSRTKQERTKRVLNSLIYYNCIRSELDYTSEKAVIAVPRRKKRTASLSTKAEMQPANRVMIYPRRKFPHMKNRRTLSKFFDLALENIDAVMEGRLKLGDLAGPIDYWVVMNVLLQHSKVHDGVPIKLHVSPERLKHIKEYILLFIRKALQTNAHYSEKRYLTTGRRVDLTIDPNLFAPGGELYGGDLRKMGPLFAMNLWYVDQGVYKISSKLFDVHGKLTN